MIVAERPRLFTRLAAWWHRTMPTRESMEQNRLLRPIAHRVLAPALWRFTRRSVPRGVALGMVTGILFPVAQIAFSAVLALPIRANIPVAAAMTFITNPFTTPFLWVAAYWIGKQALHLDAQVPGAPIATQVAANSSWLHWLLSTAGPATIVGLFIITLVLSVVGYAAAALGWRWWIARKWRSRAHARLK
ncbi:hypothetical protein MGWOODY_Smn2327 [hydrothermal vent metagenome]|uniref:DUF2062 domain-containing protein n=2 Tax=root TaxID=1 RepID=A0A161KFW0_9ZZZZ